jgi:hypothetical protein
MHTDTYRYLYANCPDLLFHQTRNLPWCIARALTKTVFVHGMRTNCSFLLAKVDHILICVEESCCWPKGYSFDPMVTGSGGWMIPDHAAIIVSVSSFERSHDTFERFRSSYCHGWCVDVLRIHETTLSVSCKQGLFWSRESPDEEKGSLDTFRTWWRYPAALAKADAILYVLQEG